MKLACRPWFWFSRKGLRQQIPKSLQAGSSRFSSKFVKVTDEAVLGNSSFFKQEVPAVDKPTSSCRRARSDYKLKSMNLSFYQLSHEEELAYQISVYSRNRRIQSYKARRKTMKQDGPTITTRDRINLHNSEAFKRKKKPNVTYSDNNVGLEVHQCCPGRSLSLIHSSRAS